MKNNLNRGILLVAIVAVVAWMIMKFMEGRKLRERYEISKEDLIKYVEEEELNPIEVMSRFMELSDDEDFTQRVYDLAKAGDRDRLASLIESL
jgi:hypothetical protein